MTAAALIMNLNPILGVARLESERPASSVMSRNQPSMPSSVRMSCCWCESSNNATPPLSPTDEQELAASGFNRVKQGEENDVNVVVDDDSEVQYGSTQYSEADVIPCVSEEPKEAQAMSALRQAVIR